VYISQLDLFGFKSFAKKTSIQFHDGVTAIVGPNGCGKTNIVDAMRWVLGEQKAGVLRSESMQNVIFNGTRTQKPLGMAEVSLTIQNNRNILPIEYSEVVVTRRLFRSGESQYLLNNTQCRLKDIMDLFMDTGMGPNAYSVIELSMVDKILNGKPDERRQIFEEAAGVTKYKIRRKAAFRKLEATEQDLIRLSDILSEVEKKTNSLRRQVSKAKRYQNLTEELRALELDYSAYQLQQIRAELQPLSENFKTLQAEREQVSSHLAGEEAQIEEWQLQLLEIERQLNARRQDLAANSQRIQRKEEDILVSQERVKAAKSAQARATQDIEEQNVRLKLLAEEKEQLQQRITGAEEELACLQEQLSQAEAALKSAQERYRARRRQGQDIEQARLRQMEEMGEISKEEERLVTRIEYASRELQARQEEAATLGGQIRATEQKIDELATQRQILLEEIEELDEALAVLQRDQGLVRSSLESGREQLLELQGQLRNRQDRAALLRRFVDTYEDYPESVRYILTENVLPGGFDGTLGDMITVDDRYRKAIEVALGEAVVALVVQDADGALQAIRHLQSTDRGAAMFVPLDSLAAANPPALAGESLPATAGVERASGLVQVTPQVRPVIEALLGHVFVAENLAEANRFARQLAGKNAAVVTLGGEIVYSWGGMRGGDSGESEAGLVGRKAIIEALDAEIGGLKEKIAGQEQALAEQETRLETLLAQQQQTEQTRGQKLKSLHAAEIALGEARVGLQRSRERQLTIEEEKQALQEQVAEFDAAMQVLHPNLEQFRVKRQEIETEYAAFQEALQEIEADLKQKEEQAQKMHLEFVTRQADVRNARQSIERIDRSVQEVGETIRRREGEIQTAGEDIERLTRRIESLREELQDDFAERKEFEEVIDAIDKQYLDRKEEIEHKEKALKSVRSRRDELAERLHRMELKISELQMHRGNLLEHIQEEYETKLEEYPVPESMESDAAAARITEIKQKLRSIGPVNLLALKDYETEKQRLDFLSSQKDDLLKAESNLKETIRVINSTAYERFTSVFSQVRENFIQVFRSFFENGNADLRLQGSDPLEDEIVIEASPKGKKLGSLALLSGGEKTLTAISLLFAIYLVKPSPFCILDEVDAPLDDANIRRFNHALEKFSDNTQFIVVTHNKLTMNASQQLYGVTMEEPGVSKVVSVRFEDIEDEKKQAQAAGKA